MINRKWVTFHHVVKGSLITSFHLTDRKWVKLHISWNAVSLYLVLWLTASKWHCTFCEGQSCCIFSYDQQRVSDMNILWRAVSSHPFLWPTVSEWHCTLCERVSHCIFSYHQQFVSDIVHLWKAVFPMTNSEWVTLYMSWKAASFDMINSLWVTLHILWKAVSFHLFL